jgi:alkanesulfonate monooxygenase SsuD/methylene tetrahydromethanopterin reductase-like flavin-dependent oxidoreductase (luciferase family)
LHDSARIEELGIPSVPVATEEFRDAARVQAARLGRSDLEAVYVAHPIQDQTRAEIEARADAVIGEIVAKLTRQPQR